MASLCKNCATPLLFDPATRKVVCPTCGGSWTAEELESTDKALRESVEAVAVDNGVAGEYLDCYVYTCSSCGGEININGTEASTKCVYCGNPSVVFNRISKEKAPEYIIPFSITQEQALDAIKKTFSNGIFIPKAVKNFKTDAIRGIYIPYWLVNGMHIESTIASYEVGSGDNSRFVNCGRSGKMRMERMPIEASLMLSDESSMRLEPFHLDALIPFDEEYLLGFYSNISDVRNSDLVKATNKRASEAFKRRVIDDINKKKSIRFKSSLSDTFVDQNVHYALLPVWFVSYEYQGKHNTIMVNGQTGKVVCGVPWSEKKFKLCVAGLSVAFTALLTVLFQWMHNSGAESLRSFLLVGFFALCALVVGASHFLTAKRHLKLSQSNSIFDFMKKRQG